MGPNLTPELRAGRRALEGLAGVRLLQDWDWHEGSGRWVLRVALSPAVGAGPLVPIQSEWCVLVDPAYPQGSIKFFPAPDGLAATFPHQSYNGPGSGEAPWRTGDLCLTTTLTVLGRNVTRQEPPDHHSRLRWHFQRALHWLERASRGELVRPGDPFELPVFPGITSVSPLVVFSEGVDTFSTWQNSADMAGTCQISPLPRPMVGFFVHAMRSQSGRTILSPSWGTAFLETADTFFTGIWVRLGSVPVIPPWQAPATWGELREACSAQGIDLQDRIRPALDQIRDGKAHIALVGFPMPVRIGESDLQFHWQAFDLPVVSWGKKSAKGFRPQTGGQWRRDFSEVLRDKTELKWLRSENWHPDQLSARGRMPPAVSENRVLVIGAGAVGAVIAELLVRAGVRDVVVLDHDNLAAGNLVRHVLDMNSIGNSKAKALAAHLNRSNPHASVLAMEDAFPPVKLENRELAGSCDVIIDATASDSLPAELAGFPWAAPKLFFSVSLGFRARRLFCFAAYGESFPDATLVEAVSPWLDEEARRYTEDDFPWEGVGCWHPVFPARVDDIWLLGSVAIKHMAEAIAASSRVRPGLAVFEQQMEGGEFAGVRRVSAEVAHG